MVYAYPVLVLAFALILTFISFYMITRLNYVLRPAIQKNPHDAERVITWELAVIWYVVLFIVSIVSLVHKIGFIFFVPISFFGTFLAALTTLFEPSTFAEPLLINGDVNHADADGPDETAPLLGDDIDDRDARDSIDDEDERLNGLMAPKAVGTSAKADWRNWLWLMRFGLMVPLPALIALEFIAWQIVPALNQTIAEGTPAALVFLVIGLFCIVAFVNTTPFLLRLPFRSTVVLLLPVFIGLIIAVSSPSFNKFTPLAPIKTYYRQLYDLDTQNSTVHLYGMDPFLEDVFPYIPAAKSNGWTCDPFYARAGRVCHYTAPRPIPPKSSGEGWFDVTATVEKDSDDEHVIAKVQIHANDTRVCFLWFDTYVPPEIVGIGGVRFDAHEMQSSLLEKGKCTTLRLFKRTWGEELFTVHLKFKKDGPRNITVACGYDEWSPGRPLGDSIVPALDEVYGNIPAWASVTKFTSGLVTVSKGINIF